MKQQTQHPHNRAEHEHEHDNDLSFGDIVTDTESPDSGAGAGTEGEVHTAVVVNTPPVTAEEWHVFDRGKTVAEDNPQYSSDSPIAIVVFMTDINSEFQFYSGVKPLKMTRVERAAVNYYAFPQPRLRKVGSRGSVKIDIHQIKPSPYHSRTFSVSQNTQFIEDIETRGEPRGPPLVWVDRNGTSGVTLLNGHRRVWASHVVGLEEIQVLGMYLDDETATRTWANRHLEGYNRVETHCAIRRLKSDWGDSYRQFL